jgi:hypothetical protein
MDNLQKNAQPAIEKLLQSTPDQLFAELGLRQKAIVNDPAQAGLFETTVTYDAAFAGPLDVLKEFGQKFFSRLSHDLYDLVCGDDKENAAERKKLVDALGGGTTVFASALTGILVSSFGLAPAIATVVAALVVKLFFKNAYGAMCAVWQRHLSAA